MTNTIESYEFSYRNFLFLIDLISLSFSQRDVQNLADRAFFRYTKYRLDVF